MKIGQLDKDGLDLIYTIGEHRNLKNVKKSSILKTFEESVRRVGSNISPLDRTNMPRTLGTIFSEYLKNTSKKMTLIILTDGLWKGTRTADDVERLIADFVKELQKKRGNLERRWVSIQFVCFGDNDHAISRLDSLDNNMNQRFDIE